MRNAFRLFLVVVLGGSMLSTVYLYRQEAQFQTLLLKQASATALRLGQSNQRLEQEADASAQHIAYEVHRNHNQAQDLAILRQMEEITRRTDTLVTELGGMIVHIQLTEPLSVVRNEIISIAGAPTNANTQMVAALTRHLEHYRAFIRKYIPDTRFLARTTLSIGSADWFAQDYIRFSYEDATVASLTRLETEARLAELEALAEQARKVGSCCFCIDEIGAVAVPVANTVEPGSLYRAQLFFAETSSRFYYNQIRVNDQKVQLIKNGKGLVSLPIPTAPPNIPDTLRTQWHGTIRTYGYPADSTWHLTVPFLIVKPTAR